MNNSFKTFTKTDIVIIIIIIFILVSIITYFVVKYDWVGAKGLTESIIESPQKCKDLGGTWVASGFGYCYGYDSDGYRFYWHIDENGVPYKTRT